MHTTVVRAGFDVGSFGTLAAWWADVVPGIATTLTVIWVTFCICEAVYVYYKKFKNKSKKKK